MAVGVLTAAPEFTKQIYDDVTEKMFGHASPIALLALAGAVDYQPLRRLATC